MKNTLTKIALPIVAIIILLLMVAWMAGAFDEKIEPGTQPSSAILLDQADLSKVIARDEMLYEPVPASIEAKQTTIVSSRILARIENINVRAGTNVNKGQLLIQLEKNDLDSQVSQAQQQIQSMNAQLTEAQQSLKRATTLHQQGVIAKADLDKAKANHDTLLANQAIAHQALEGAKTALSFAQILAPINGRIVDRFAEPGDTAQPGVRLLSLYNPTSLRIEAHVREQLAVNLAIGQGLDVSIPSANLVLHSTIEELVPAGDPGSRSFLVKSRLQSTQGLMPGMYARLLVPVGKQQLLIIPADKVAKVGQLNVVWTLKNEQVERRYIRLGKPLGDNQVVVISGLQAGDVLLAPPRH